MTRTILILFSAIVSWGDFAWAAPWEPKGSTARAKLDEGRTAFQAKEYAHAGELFASSDAAEANLNARWNAAQSFAAAGEWQRASGLYDSLIADRELPKDRRAAVEARRAMAARFMAAQYAQDAKKWDEARGLLLQLVNDRALGDTDRATAVARIDALTRAQADAERAAASPPERPEPGTSGGEPPPPPPPQLVRPSLASDRLSLAFIGAGVVGVGIGGGLLVSANGLDDDANAEPNDQRARDLHGRADSRRTFGMVALGVGGAVLAAGVVKFILPPAARPVTSVASFRPLDGGGVLVLSGALP